MGIGLFLLALAETEPQAGVWPLLSARVVLTTLFGALALVGAQPLRMAAPIAGSAVAAGAIYVTANALYMLATRTGALSVTVTLSSLYPASTIILARLVLGERLNGWQVSGVACALLAITFLVGGSQPS